MKSGATKAAMDDMVGSALKDGYKRGATDVVQKLASDQVAAEKRNEEMLMNCLLVLDQQKQQHPGLAGSLY